jgi:hypothetical protein
MLAASWPISVPRLAILWCSKLKPARIDLIVNVNDHFIIFDYTSQHIPTKSLNVVLIFEVQLERQQ